MTRTLSCWLLAILLPAAATAQTGVASEPLCYAQIGGLTMATFVTLLLVPVLYATFVLDLKVVSWGDKQEAHAAPAIGEATPAVEAI